MKGQLPITGLLKLESNKDQWNLLKKGLIRELNTTALIERENLASVRIKLVITSIISPNESKKSCSCSVVTNLGDEISMGMTRTVKFFSDYIAKSEWVFFGYISGDTNLPIIILYYESINIFIYSQKLKTEENDLFFKHLSLN